MVIVWRVMAVDPVDRLITHFAGQRGNTWYDLKHVDDQWRIMTTTIHNGQTLPDRQTERYQHWSEMVNANPVVRELNDLMFAEVLHVC